MALDPYLSAAADPSTGLLYLWQNAPWAVEGTLLFIFLLPIFLAGGKKAKFEEKHLLIFAAVFAAATELSFQIIGISFVHFTGWIILAFCALVALAAWSVLIHNWCNEKHQYSIPIGLLLFTYMFTFIESAKELSEIPTLGFWPSASAIAITRAASLWLLIISVLMGLNAHMGPAKLSKLRENYKQHSDKVRATKKVAKEKADLIKSLDPSLRKSAKDVRTALELVVSSETKAVAYLTRIIAKIKTIADNLGRGNDLTPKDAKDIGTFSEGIKVQKQKLIQDIKNLKDKYNTAISSIDSAKKNQLDLINSVTELVNDAKTLDPDAKSFETRLKKSKLHKLNQNEAASITASLVELRREINELNTQLGGVDNSLKGINWSAIDTAKDELKEIPNLTDSIIRLLQTNEPESTLKTLSLSAGQDPTTLGIVFTNTINRLNDLNGLLQNLDTNANTLDSNAQKVDVLVRSNLDRFKQIPTQLGELSLKLDPLPFKLNELAARLEGHENALKQQGQIKTNIQQLIDVLNAEIATLNQTFNGFLGTIKNINQYTRPKSVPVTMLNNLKASMTSELTKAKIDKSIAEASLLKIKDVLDDLNNTGHASTISPILAKLQTEEAQIIDNFDKFKANITVALGQIDQKVQDATTASPPQTNVAQADTGPILTSIIQESDKIKKFTQDLQGFVAQLQKAAKPSP